VKFEALPTDDPARRKPDITRAYELLRWQPHVSLEEGLKLTIDYFVKTLVEHEDGVEVRGRDHALTRPRSLPSRELSSI
jgi:hypothetical protein